MKIEVNRMNVEIRLMQENELEEVASLVQKVFGYYTVPKQLTIDDFSVVAIVDNRIVGQILVHPIVDPFLNRMQYYLQDICVDSTYRENGIASKMIHYIFTLAQKNHIFRVFLTSKKTRLEAHELYKKLGFYERDSDVFAKDF